MLENLHRHTNPSLLKPCQETHAISKGLIDGGSCLMDYTRKRIGEMGVCVLDVLDS